MLSTGRAAWVTCGVFSGDCGVLGSVCGVCGGDGVAGSGAQLGRPAAVLCCWIQYGRSSGGACCVGVGG